MLFWEVGIMIKNAYLIYFGMPRASKTMAMTHKEFR